MGEGNAFHNQLVAPAAARLLAPQAWETILDVACGNGQFSRQLAALGARVVATDFSATFLARAAARTIEYAERITYRQLDATDEAALLALGAGRFDAAICNMALMDMPTIAPLLRTLRQLLKPGGRFVFAVPHPCFNNNATRLTLEEEDRAGELRETRGVRIAEYLQIPPGKGPGCRASPCRTTTSIARCTNSSGSASRRASRSMGWRSRLSPRHHERPRPFLGALPADPARPRRPRPLPAALTAHCYPELAQAQPLR